MLKAPAWCPHAIPTLAGWEDPHSGELLKSANHTQQQVAEWHGIPAPAPQTLREAPVVEREVTKSEYSWHHGITGESFDEN